MPARFHPHTRLHALLFQLAVKLLGFLAMQQAPFAKLTASCVHECNLPEARMIVTTLYLACNCPILRSRASWGIRSGFGGRPFISLGAVNRAAWIIDRPPALLSHAVENPRPFEPAFTRSAREVAQGRGAGTQSNPIVRIV